MNSLSDHDQAHIIEALKSKLSYKDGHLYVDKPYFECMVDQMYGPELQLNNVNALNTKAPGLLDASVHFKWFCFIQI